LRDQILGKARFHYVAGRFAFEYIMCEDAADIYHGDTADIHQLV